MTDLACLPAECSLDHSQYAHLRKIYYLLICSKNNLQRLQKRMEAGSVTIREFERIRLGLARETVHYRKVTETIQKRSEEQEELCREHTALTEQIAALTEQIGVHSTT